jgi:hypothetical protein
MYIIYPGKTPEASLEMLRAYADAGMSRLCPRSVKTGAAPWTAAFSFGLFVSVLADTVLLRNSSRFGTQTGTAPSGEQAADYPVQIRTLRLRVRRRPLDMIDDQYFNRSFRR